MDWPLIAFTAAASWFALLLAGDIAALVTVPPRLIAVAHNVAFAATLGGVLLFGFSLASEHRPHPCPPVRVHR